MSGIIKQKPLKFLYVVDKELLREFAKVTKQNAPLPYQIAPSLRKFVKRYTDRTYHYVELHNGKIVSTRAFNNHPYRYTGNMDVKLVEWIETARTLVYPTCHEERHVIEQQGGVVNCIYFRYNVEMTKARLKVLAAGAVLVDCTFDVTPRICLHLDDIGLNLAYLLRKMYYGALTGCFDMRYLKLIMDQFDLDHREFIGSSTRWADILKRQVEFLPLIPARPVVMKSLTELENLIVKLGDFPTSVLNGPGKKQGKLTQVEIPGFDSRSDARRLRELAKWVDGYREDELYYGVSFTRELTASPTAISYPNVHRALVSYYKYGGSAKWNFNSDKRNLLDYCLATLHKKSLESSCHSAWLNVYRAVLRYERGEIALFDPSRAGNQLATLNDIVGGTMTKRRIIGKDVNFNNLRTWYLFKSIIKPALEEALSNQGN